MGCTITRCCRPDILNKGQARHDDTGRLWSGVATRFETQLEHSRPLRGTAYQSWRSVYLYYQWFVDGRSMLVGPWCTVEFFDGGGGDIYHICAGPQTQDESMGSHD